MGRKEPGGKFVNKGDFEMMSVEIDRSSGPGSAVVLGTDKVSGTRGP